MIAVTSCYFHFFVQGAILWDNDSLAALLACEASVDLVVFIGDTDGVYAPCAPSSSGLQLRRLPECGRDTAYMLEPPGSRVGRAGTALMVDAMLRAVESGVVKVCVPFNE